MILMSDLVCSRGAATAGSIATGGTMALMTVTAGVPLSSIAKGVIKREAVECLSALVRRADQGEPPARQATETNVGEAVRSRCSSSASTAWRISALGHRRGAAVAVAVAAVALVAPVVPLPSAPVVLPKAR